MRRRASAQFRGQYLVPRIVGSSVNLLGWHSIPILRTWQAGTASPRVVYPIPTQERVPMSLYLIAVLVVVAVWLVESIVFLAGYRHSRSS